MCIMSKRTERLCVSLFLTFILCIIVAGGLSGCESSSESERRKLTADEIEQVNVAFAPTVNDGKDINPLGIYLIPNYDSPYDLNLAEFLAYFPSNEEVTDENEFEHLKKSEHWSFGDNAKLSTMPVPIHKFPASDVENKLKEGFGIELRDLNYTPSSDLMYLEEYDCFYNTTSDALFGYFSCTEGYLAGDTVVLFGENRELELHFNGNKWLFYSLKEVSEISEPISDVNSDIYAVAGLGTDRSQVAPDGLNEPSDSDFALETQREEYQTILDNLDFSSVTYFSVYSSPNDESKTVELTSEQAQAFLSLIKSIKLETIEPTNPNTGGTFSVYIVTQNDILTLSHCGSILFISKNGDSISQIFSGENCFEQFSEMQSMVYELFEN